MTDNTAKNFSEQQILAIIPARGGSKGIPRKNLKPLAGKPLIAHAIAAALQADLVNRVVVSTDDDEIAAVSVDYGAEVVRRPDAISGDSAGSELALIHALKHLRQKENYKPWLIVFIQCTSPLTRPEDIDAVIQVLKEENADSALSVTDFHYFLWETDKSGNAIGINHDKQVRLLRQDRNNQFLETGAVYVMKVETFLEKKHRFFGRTAMSIMPRARCFEIDEPIDLKIAEILLTTKTDDH